MMHLSKIKDDRIRRVFQVSSGRPIDLTRHFQGAFVLLKASKGLCTDSIFGSDTVPKQRPLFMFAHPL